MPKPVSTPDWVWLACLDLYDQMPGLMVGFDAPTVDTRPDPDSWCLVVSDIVMAHAIANQYPAPAPPAVIPPAPPEPPEAYTDTVD